MDKNIPNLEEKDSLNVGEVAAFTVVVSVGFVVSNIILSLRESILIHTISGISADKYTSEMIEASATVDLHALFVVVLASFLAGIPTYFHSQLSGLLLKKTHNRALILRRVLAKKPTRAVSRSIVCSPVGRFKLKRRESSLLDGLYKRIHSSAEKFLYLINRHLYIITGLLVIFFITLLYYLSTCSQSIQLFSLVLFLLLFLFAITLLVRLSTFAFYSVCYLLFCMGVTFFEVILM